MAAAVQYGVPIDRQGILVIHWVDDLARARELAVEYSTTEIRQRVIFA
jgi:hypothetical protein